MSLSRKKQPHPLAPNRRINPTSGLRTYPPPKRKRGEPLRNALNYAQIAEEAAHYAPGPFGFLMWLDARLVAAGWHPMSDWWRATIEHFYASGKRWAVVLVGRGGGKSTTLVRVAVAEALFAMRLVPPGQRFSWPFLSASPGDARMRIVEIAAILGVLEMDASIKNGNTRPTIELQDARGNDIAFLSLAATIAGVSGPTTLGATVDEEAKMLGPDRSVNPIVEILASLGQTFRARTGIRAIRCSSAWTSDSAHANAIREGDTVTNFVARLGAEFLQDAVDGFVEVATWEHARGDTVAAEAILTHARSLNAESAAVATWIANPSISPIASRIEVEAVPREKLQGWKRSQIWLRECGSVTFGGAGGSGASIIGLNDRIREVQRLVRADWARNVHASGFGGGTPGFDVRPGYNRHSGLATQSGLPRWDPRSEDYGEPEGDENMLGALSAKDIF